jgi:hypothetical protein
MQIIHSFCIKPNYTKMDAGELWRKKVGFHFRINAFRQLFCRIGPSCEEMRKAATFLLAMKTCKK